MNDTGTHYLKKLRNESGASCETETLWPPPKLQQLQIPLPWAKYLLRTYLGTYNEGIQGTFEGLGAEPIGLSLPIEKQPSLHEGLGLLVELVPWHLAPGYPQLLLLRPVSGPVGQSIV